MATREDAILSMYYKTNQFIDYLRTIDDLPQFNLAVTTSIESANTMLMDGTNKLILVQTQLEEKFFLSMEYKLFVSFADNLDTNALLTTRVISELDAFMPQYSTVEIFEAGGLKKKISEFIPTGCKLVVQSVEQKTASIPQMRNNLTTAVLKLTGFLK
jgi:hypothetical protein